MRSQGVGQERPAGVTVIAVLNIIGGAIIALLALVALGAGPEELDLEPGEVAAGAIFLMALAALQITVSVGLLRLRNWARITALVLYSLGALLGFIELVVAGNPLGLLKLVISLVAAVYLNAEGVRDAFYPPLPATWSSPRSETLQEQSDKSESSTGLGPTL